MQSNALSQFAHPSLIVIAVLQVSLALAAATVGYVLTTLGPTIQCGATFVFPLTYVLSDITAEVYGYKIAKKFIWMTLCCELLFGVTVSIVVSLPDISIENQMINQSALGGVLTFVVSGFVAAVISNFLNIYLVSKWKILVSGKYFCIRSVCSTAIASLLLVIITIIIAFHGKMSYAQMFHLMFSAYLLELTYAFIFAYPAFFIAEFIKKKEKIDVYDFGTNFNPFRLT